MVYISTLIALFGGYILWNGLRVPFPDLAYGWCLDNWDNIKFCYLSDWSLYMWLGLVMMLGGILMFIFSKSWDKSIKRNIGILDEEKEVDERRYGEVDEEKIIESPQKEKHWWNDLIEPNYWWTLTQLKDVLIKGSVVIVVLSILKIYRTSQGVEQCFLCIFPLW